MPRDPVFIRLARARSAAILSAVLLLVSACQVSTPGAFETKFMQGAKRRITVGGKSDVNPVVASKENIHAGQRNFTSYCMVCHGLDGQNTGVPFADKMSPPVPMLSAKSVQDYTDGQLHWIIQNGIAPSGMPAAKEVFRDEEIWQLVLYIRHLPPKGSLGEPEVYGGTGPPAAERKRLAAKP
jgi:mono/diheme cytochrome c family protein